MASKKMTNISSTGGGTGAVRNTRQATARATRISRPRNTSPAQPVNNSSKKPRK